MAKLEDRTMETFLRKLQELLVNSGTEVQLVQDKYLTMEGLVTAMEDGPFVFGQNKDEMERFISSLARSGFVPLSSKGNNHLIGISVDQETETDITNRMLVLEELISMVNLSKADLRFLLLTKEQFSEIAHDSFAVVKDSRARHFYLNSVNVDDTAMEGFWIIVRYAVIHGASDIHIEIEEDCGRVRFRIDGVLRTAPYKLSSEVAKKLVSVIKNRAGLKMEEHRLPQDGRISFTPEEIQENSILDGRSMRISLIPTFYGEKAVLRVMKTKSSNLELSALDMDKFVVARLKRTIKSPHGLILITGPTGSGKTTTLYCALEALNDGSRNIVTVEDPIEIPMRGIVQSQVNAPLGYTFSSALRAFLRQDPDVILVGEMRDQETAETAVYAANTGHLVFATIHTNDAISVLSRIRGFGLHNVNIASGLLAVVSQRLVRKICPNCYENYDGTEHIKYLLGNDYLDGLRLTLRQSIQGNRDCPHCQGTGYSGRFPLAEFWSIGQEEEALILNGENNPDVYFRTAVGKGFKPLAFSAIEALIAGVTDIKEVLRIALMPDDFLRIGPEIGKMLRNKVRSR